jgi:hypothetical protein
LLALGKLQVKSDLGSILPPKLGTALLADVEQSSAESTNVSKAKQVLQVILYTWSFQGNGKRAKSNYANGAEIPDRATVYFTPGTAQYERQLYVSSHISSWLALFNLIE